VQEIALKTDRKTQLVDITKHVQDALDGANGARAALVYVPHTTAGVTINEGADPLVGEDIESALQQVVHEDWQWKHTEDPDGPTIQFDAPMIRLEGPIAPADVQPGAEGSVTVLGNTVRRAAQLRDEDAIYASGIAQARQVELRGYLDHLGVRWATRARLRGAPDPADSRAGGPVDNVARPLLSVLGLTLDTTGATFEDPAGNAIDADTFFAGALPGASIEQSGSWNGVDTLVGGVVALIAPLDPPAGAGAPRSLIVGTLRGGDHLFADGFD